MSSIDIIDGEALHTTVALDGLARVVTATDGSTHVLYWDGTRVRSMEASAWPVLRGPLPVDPTSQQSTDAIAARETARLAALAAAATKRQQILTIAQSAVGVRVDLLTAAQIKALYAITLWQQGALDAGLIVRPLADWVDR
jgi:hypothetical protein